MTLVVQNTLDPQLYNSLANLTGSQTVANKTLKVVKEPVTFVNAPPASTTYFDVATQSVSVYNTATENFTLRIRGNSTTTLNSMLAVGESVGISLFVPNGSTAYRMLTTIWIDDGTMFNADGYANRIYYQNGTPFTAGNANAVDLYMLFIIKKAENSFNMYASQTKYA